jgi:CRP/FNR family transcriptional regulator
MAVIKHKDNKTTNCSSKKLFEKPVFIYSPLNEVLSVSKKKMIIVFEKEESLFSENEGCGGLYFVITGKIKIVKTDMASNQCILFIAKPGDFLGLHAIINEHLHTTSAIALTKSTVCFIPTDEFMEIIESNNTAKLVVMQLLCKRIDQLEDKLTMRSERPTDSRLADSLLSLLASHGTDSNNCIKIELKPEDLASMVGTSRAYMHKIINEFIKQKIISYELNRIKILDLRRLKDMIDTASIPAED